MVIYKCYFSREHTARSYKKWYEHGIRKTPQIKSTAHDAKSYLKQTDYVSINQAKALNIVNSNNKKKHYVN